MLQLDVGERGNQTGDLEVDMVRSAGVWALDVTLGAVVAVGVALAGQAHEGGDRSTAMQILPTSKPSGSKWGSGVRTSVG